MKVALYARVSKAEDQTPENQLLQLRTWAAASGATVEGEYAESVSSRETRPMKEDLLKKLRLGTLDGVAFVSLSRWGRSVAELASEMKEAMDRGWTLVSLKEGLRFDTAAGKAFGGMLAVFAEFERDLVRERTMAGLARARAQGKVLGRPRKTPAQKQGGISLGAEAVHENGRLIELGLHHKTPESARVGEPLEQVEGGNVLNSARQSEKVASVVEPVPFVQPSPLLVSCPECAVAKGERCHDPYGGTMKRNHAARFKRAATLNPNLEAKHD